MGFFDNMNVGSYGQGVQTSSWKMSQEDKDAVSKIPHAQWIRSQVFPADLSSMITPVGKGVKVNPPDDSGYWSALGYNA